MKHRTILIAFVTTVFVAGGSLATSTTETQAMPGANWKLIRTEQEEKSKKDESGKSNADALKQDKLAREAKITMEQARETALKRAPGKIESSELEREHHKLVYSFDIRNAKGSITEVQVSALTGEIVRVEHENSKKEAAEKKRENKEKSGKARRQP